MLRLVSLGELCLFWLRLRDLRRILGSLLTWDRPRKGRPIALPGSLLVAEVDLVILFVTFSRRYLSLVSRSPVFQRPFSQLLFLVYVSVQCPVSPVYLSFPMFSSLVFRFSASCAKSCFSCSSRSLKHVSPFYFLSPFLYLMLVFPVFKTSFLKSVSVFTIL